MLYGNLDTLTFEDVKSNLLSKEKCDVEAHFEDRGEVLNVRGKIHEKRSTNHSQKTRSKSRRHKSNNKTYHYYKKSGHEISKYYKLKNK